MFRACHDCWAEIIVTHTWPVRQQQYEGKRMMEVEAQLLLTHSYRFLFVARNEKQYSAVCVSCIVVLLCCRPVDNAHKVIIRCYYFCCCCCCGLSITNDIRTHSRFPPSSTLLVFLSHRSLSLRLQNKINLFMYVVYVALLTPRWYEGFNVILLFGIFLTFFFSIRRVYFAPLARMRVRVCFESRNALSRTKSIHKLI